MARLLVIKRTTTFVFKLFSHNLEIDVKDLNNQIFSFLLLSVLSFTKFFFLSKFVENLSFYAPNSQ